MRGAALPLAALLAVPLLTGAAPPGAAVPNAEVSGTQVTVTATGLRSAKGVVRACMSPDPERFPRCQGDPKAYLKVVPAAERVSFTFTGVAPGDYAIALLHDANDNGKADRALWMMPTEGFGFSRDAKVRMGPPSFKDAVITISQEPVHFDIRMRYLF